MAKKIKINFRDIEEFEVDEGTSLLDISSKVENYFEYPIIVGRVDNHITSLSENIMKSCRVDFYDRSSGVGNSVYGRTCQFLLVVA